MSDVTKSAVEKGKLLYFDPNNVTINSKGENLSAIFNGLELVKDVEDYSIAIDLEVVNKSRNNVTINDVQTLSLVNANKPSNFLQGKNIGDTNVLTSFFSDIKFSEDNIEDLNESMCINSIDIEFTSWYVASVIIKFTDVRGAALYSPSESSLSKGENGKIGGENVFSSFFTMPYPIFKLKVKGFYGNTVTYPLHLTDFKSEFNSDKGNMDITCHFIGYTYAMLNDIQMTYLIAAPNCSEGNAYWLSQIENNRFKTLEGKDIPKMSQLLQRIQDGETVKSEMDTNDSQVKSVKELKEQEGLLTQIKTNIDYYISALSRNYVINTNSNNYDLIIIRKDNNTSVLTPDMGYNKEISNYILNLTALVSKFNNTYQANSLFLKYENPIDIFRLNVETENKATLNLSDTVVKIDTYLKESNNEVKKLGDQISDSVNNRLTEIYGMIPSIYNFTKLLLAHMETLLHIIAECANKVSKDERENEIAAGNQETDIIGNKLSPFPWFTVNKKDEWIGNYYRDIPEVKLVNSLLNAKQSVSSDLQKIDTQINTPSEEKIDTSISFGDVWIPINAFDNSINKIGGKTKAPYSNLSNSAAYLDEMNAVLSNRIATIVGLSSHLGNDKKYYNSFSLGEAKNIINYLGQNNETIKQTIVTLDTLEDQLSGAELLTRGKYRPLTLYQSQDKNYYYEYNLLNTKGLLPLNDDLISEREKYISGGQIVGLQSESLRIYDQKFSSNETDDNFVGPVVSRYNPTNTIIVEGREDCKYIYEGWFKRVENLYVNSNEQDISYMLERYKLSPDNYLKSFIDVTYESQPLLNKITYLKNEAKIGNSTTIKEFDDKCGLTETPFNTKDDEFINIYKAYLGERDFERVRDKRTEAINITKFIKNENIDIKTLTYPMIGGLYSKKFTKKEKNKREKNARSIFCLFGSELYYHQNSIITADPNNNLKVIQANRAKAFLFLQSLPVNIVSFDDLLTDPNQLDRSFMIRISKVEALLIGSMLWEQSDGGKLNLLDDYAITKKYHTYRYLRNRDGAFVLRKYVVKDMFEQNSTLAKGLILINKHKGIREQFINFFYDWVNSSNPDGWVTIRDAFEFRGPNNELFDLKKFLGFSLRLFELGTTIVKVYEELHPDCTKNYYNISPLTNDTVGLINKDGSDGVNSVLTLLFNQCVVAYSGDATLYGDDRNEPTTLSEQKVSAIAKGIKNRLKEQSETIKTEGISLPEQSLDTLTVIDDENIKLQVYKYLKNLYDKWVSGFEFNSNSNDYKWISLNKSVVNGYKDTYDLINFKFIDRSYNNIGDKFIINFKDIIDNMIGLSEEKSLYSTITDILSKNQFLFIPMPNYQSWTNADDFAKIFQPMPYSNAAMINNSDETLTSIFICMYTGSPSRRLNIGNKTYSYQDDALNLNIIQTNNIDEDFQTTAEKDLENTSLIMNKVPAFAVSYGKQNQSYFKNITLNQNDPVTTEASINVLRQLNDRTDKKSAVTTTSQDMYKIYSDYAYTCSVEMLGCAQIQPMMYFQLTNIPMWNGAYLIYKVNHSIQPGSMETKFTGMRMSKNYPKLITPGVITSDRLNNAFNITPESTLISTLSLDTPMRRYFTLGEYCRNVDEIPEYIVNRIYNNLGPTIDSIYDTWIVSSEGKKYGKFILTSGYRPNSTTSQHSKGLAADIQLATPSEEGNEALFRHIISRMNSGLKMDQLINEVDSDNARWCHVSPVCFKNNVVDIRGQYSYGTLQSSGKTTLTNIMYSENAKGSGKLLSDGDELELFIRYIKGAENGILAGWDKNTRLWEPYGNAKVTIGYGIVFKLNGQLNVVTPEMKDAITPYLNDTSKIRITNRDMERELRTQISNGLNNIKKDIDHLYGKGTYYNINNKYRYAIYDLYHNFGPSGYKDESTNPINIRFIKAAIKNDLTEMLNNANRIVNGTLLEDRTKRFKEYLKS